MHPYEDHFEEWRRQQYEETHTGYCDVCGCEDYLSELIETQDDKRVCGFCVIYCKTCKTPWSDEDYIDGDYCSLCYDNDK